jgi:hypothetical protein
MDQEQQKMQLMAYQQQLQTVEMQLVQNPAQTEVRALDGACAAEITILLRLSNMARSLFQEQTLLQYIAIL